jgi:hypothetical protein
MRGESNALAPLAIVAGIAVAAVMFYTLNMGMIMALGGGFLTAGIAAYLFQSGTKIAPGAIVLGVVLLLVPTITSTGNLQSLAGDKTNIDEVGGTTGVGVFQVTMVNLSGNGTVSGDKIITTGIYNSTANTFSGVNSFYVNYTIIPTSYGGARFTQCEASVGPIPSIADNANGGNYYAVNRDSQNVDQIYITDGTSSQVKTRTLYYDMSTTTSKTVQVRIDLNPKVLDPLATYGSVTIPIQVCGKITSIEFQKTSEVS